MKKLVVNHIEVREREASSNQPVNDPIRGKGEGLILLFHGIVDVCSEVPVALTMN